MERHNLFCYLGQEKGFSPYISKKFKLVNADAAALYTRGIWENVDDGELKDAFAEAADEPQSVVDAVEDMLLSRQPKNLEKYTFAAIFFNKVFVDPNRKRKIRKILMIAIPIVLVLAVLIVILSVRYNNKKNNIAEMEQSFYNTIEYIQVDNYLRAKSECQNALDLANKLKNTEIQNDTSNYMKLIESVIAGDTALDSGEYQDAQRNYLNAQIRSRYADNLGLDYIQERLDQTGQYITVYDMIALGDTLVNGLQYEKAEEQYIAAQLLAGNIYFTEGRDRAISALERLYESMRQEQADNEEAAQQASEAQSAAASILADGDAAFASGDYTSALTYYTTALQKYIELEDETQTAALRIKIVTTEDKLAEQKALAAEAEEYMTLAENAYTEKNYVQAKKYYLLARDVYSVMRSDEKVAEVSRRMELVEMGISAEEEAAREAEEAARRAEEEAAQKAEAEQAKQDAEDSVPDGKNSVSPDAVAGQCFAVMAVCFVLLRLVRLIKSPCFDGLFIVLPHHILRSGTLNKWLCAGTPVRIGIPFVNQYIEFHRQFLLVYTGGGYVRKDTSATHCLRRSAFHEVGGQYIYQQMAGKVTCVYFHLILPQLGKFLQAKDFAGFRLFLVVRRQTFGYIELPFSQKTPGIFNIIVLTVIICADLPDRAPRLNFHCVIGLVWSCGPPQEEQITLVFFHTFPVPFRMGETVVQFSPFHNDLLNARWRNDDIFFTAIGIFLPQRGDDVIQMRILLKDFSGFNGNILVSTAGGQFIMSLP